MIKIQQAPISFIYNPKGTNSFLVCYAPEDDKIEVFRRAYQYVKYSLKKKGEKNE
ncbi:hypothetical protein [Candidatus Stoquefichus sp. SB1]|uniref:hypothetical protein n=1 Tax=Candidatus Stoquefichus sp. SB1 TaxID=1658109 RepID=UPI0012FE9939|nr:hypothetical protein [Candidatus Stoquefichus sp. SB1]